MQQITQSLPQSLSLITTDTSGKGYWKLVIRWADPSKAGNEPVEATVALLAEVIAVLAKYGAYESAEITFVPFTDITKL